ncbi:MAG: trypsin-like serine protease [Chloroflexota bacterium]
MLTAGHCVDTYGNEDRYHDGHSIGDPGKNSYWDGSDTDFALLNLPSSVQDSMSGHRYYANNDYKTRSVHARQTNAVGDLVKYAGIATNTGSGGIKSIDYTSSREDGDVVLNTMVWATAEISAGDSGGPVFIDDYARGVVSGCKKTDDSPCNNDPLVYSSINRLYSARTEAGVEFAMEVCQWADSVEEC